MSATKASTPAPNLESLRDWVDDVADQFEAQWRHGSRPAIAAFLGDDYPPPPPP